MFIVEDNSLISFSTTSSADSHFIRASDTPSLEDSAICCKAFLRCSALALYIYGRAHSGQQRHLLLLSSMAQLILFLVSFCSNNDNIYLNGTTRVVWLSDLQVALDHLLTLYRRNNAVRIVFFFYNK